MRWAVEGRTFITDYDGEGTLEIVSSLSHFPFGDLDMDSELFNGDPQLMAQLSELIIAEIKWQALRDQMTRLRNPREAMLLSEQLKLVNMDLAEKRRDVTVSLNRIRYGDTIPRGSIFRSGEGTLDYGTRI